MSAPPADAAPGPSVGLLRIFCAFLRLGSTAFGGGTAGWLYRDIVQKRGWIEDREFLAALGLAQVMPGANGIKMTVLIGRRLHGGLGAVVALVGLLAGPFVIVLALGGIYAGFADNKMLETMLDGVAGAVIGLTFATGLHSIRQDAPHATGLAFTAVTVLCVGVLRWPILPVIAGLAPLSIGLALIAARHR